MSKWLSIVFWQWVFFYGLLSLGLIALFVHPIFNNDFWIHLKVGQWIVEHGHIPEQVVFAFGTAKGFPFVAHSWLSSYLFYWGFYFFGPSLVWLKGGLFLLLFFLLRHGARHFSADALATTLLTATSLIALSCRSMLRPEIFALLLFACMLHALGLLWWRGEHKYACVAMILQGIWANLHGSFMLGVTLPIWFCLLDLQTQSADLSKVRWQLWLKLFIGLCLISCINPYGWHLWQHCIALSTADYLHRYIVEWRPIWHKLWPLSFPTLRLGLSITVFLSLWLKHRSQLPWVIWLWISFFTVLAISSYRHTAFAAIAFFYPSAYTLRFCSKMVLKEHLPWLLVVMGLFLSLDHFLVQQKNRSQLLSIGARAFIQQTPEMQGRVFNSYTYGAELLYYFYPRLEVVIDSRVDAYGKDYFMDYLHTIYQPWQQIKYKLNKQQVHWMVLNAKEAQCIVPHIQSTTASSAWQICYRDERTWIFGDAGCFDQGG